MEYGIKFRRFVALFLSQIAAHFSFHLQQMRRVFLSRSHSLCASVCAMVIETTVITATTMATTTATAAENRECVCDGVGGS